jgi:hypothetical protein
VKADHALVPHCQELPPTTLHSLLK